MGLEFSDIEIKDTSIDGRLLFIQDKIDAVNNKLASTNYAFKLEHPDEKTYVIRHPLSPHVTYNIPEMKDSVIQMYEYFRDYNFLENIRWENNEMRYNKLQGPELNISKSPGIIKSSSTYVRLSTDITEHGFISPIKCDLQKFDVDFNVLMNELKFYYYLALICQNTRKITNPERSSVLSGIGVAGICMNEPADVVNFVKWCLLPENSNMTKFYMVRPSDIQFSFIYELLYIHTGLSPDRAYLAQNTSLYSAMETMSINFNLGFEDNETD